jgi:hypothetical protein
VNRYRQSLLIALWWADATRFTSVPPQRSPRCHRRIQQIVGSDTGRSVREVPFNL